MPMVIVIVQVQDVNVGHEDVIKPAYSKDIPAFETSVASPATFSKVIAGRQRMDLCHFNMTLAISNSSDYRRLAV